jgi:putrescine aminotransferase
LADEEISKKYITSHFIQQIYIKGITRPMKEPLITLEEVDKLSIKSVREYYLKHINKGIPKFLSMLCLDGLEIEYSEGIYIHTKCGRKIYDFTGGFSVLNLGHNHPRIIRARRRFNEKKQMEIWKTFLSPYLAALSRNIAALSPGDLNYVFICNSGAEANEGALKLAEKYQGTGKRKIIYTDLSFHGKTHAAMSVSGCEPSRKFFKLLDNCFSVPYGDWHAFEQTIQKSLSENSGSNDIIAIILEAVHAEGVIKPPTGYLQNVRRLCDEHNILMIIDEVLCGFGRTGKMFSFEHDDIIPDIFTVAKSLGGGKASVGAYIARDGIFNKAYGRLQDSMIHSSTFSGLGEECYTAIESINVLVEDGLVNNSREMGEYFLTKLIDLKDKHEGIIEDLRGVGLLICMELRQPAKKIVKMLENISTAIRDFSDGFLTGIIVSLLVHKYNILVTPGPHEKRVIMIIPPLIVNRNEIDYFIASIDELFSMNITSMVKAYSSLKVRNIIS